MNKQSKKQVELFSRYILILLLGLGNLYLFYIIFTPITLFLTSKILSIFYNPITFSNTIFIEGLARIQLIPACIAGSAYYLLTILNLSTPNLSIKKRTRVLLITFAAFLVLNTLRIVILAFLQSSTYFETLHLIFWYGLSTLFVVGIWFLTTKIFKIKDIPFYTDIKYLGKSIKTRKNTKRRKKN